MRRVTVTISDDIETTLDAHIRQQFTAVPRKLRITPARKGSGARDISVQHDRYLAGK